MQAFSPDSELLAAALQPVDPCVHVQGGAKSSLLIVRLSDGVHELLSSEGDLSIADCVRLQWGFQHGRPRLAWLQPSWLLQLAAKVQDVPSLGCDVVSLDWTSAADSHAQWACSGEAVCLLGEHALQLWRADWADSRHRLISGGQGVQGVQCVWSPCEQLILCLGWVEHSRKATFGFYSGTTGSFVRGQQTDAPGRCRGLAWSSTGVVALSAEETVYLGTVPDAVQPCRCITPWGLLPWSAGCTSHAVDGCSPSLTRPEHRQVAARCFWFTPGQARECRGLC